MAKFRLADRVRSAVLRWRTAAAVVSNALLAEFGARIGLPGVDGQRIHEFFQAMPRGLLALYDALVGGGLSRAAIFCLGAVPYLQAQLYLYVARSAFPNVRCATASPHTRRAVVRVGTVGLAVLQAWGFARFLESIRGAVADPGIGFLGRTVLLITGGAIVVGWLAETVADLAAAPRIPDDLDEHGASTPAPREAATLVDRSLGETNGVPLLDAGTPDFLNQPVTANRDFERTH